MRKPNAMLVAFISVLALMSPALAGGPSPYAPGMQNGHPHVLDRETCWDEPGDPDNWKISSDTMEQFGLESETANDFLFDHDDTITRWIALAGPYCWAPGDPDPTIMNFKFYADADGVPGEVLLAVYGVEPEKTFIQMGHEGPVYRFEYNVHFEVTAHVRYWFVLQAATHEFPPCWGRLLADQLTEMESMFWSPYFGYPEWTPVFEVVGVHADVVQAFECGEPTPVAATSWGSVRALYR